MKSSMDSLSYKRVC